MLLLLTVIQLTKYLQRLSLVFLTSELPALKMIFLTMLLKPLTSSLNIGTRRDMALTLLKALILWLRCLYSFAISSDLIVPYLILHLLKLPGWNILSDNKILCYLYPDFRLANTKMVALWFVIGRALARSFLPLTNHRRAFTSFQAKICDIL